MKEYTLHDAAEILGIPLETLQERMATIQLEPGADSSRQPVLNDEQLQELGRTDTSPLPEPVTPLPTEEPVEHTSALPDPVTPPLEEVVPPLKLGAQTITLGRFPDNQVVLNHPQVSGYHARLERVRTGSYRIVDLHSTNHTYVNGQRVKKQLLSPGDQIQIGPWKLIITEQELIQEDPVEDIRVDGLHLKQYGKWRQALLQDVSLAIPPRSFVALVGGSGVGKTTLLNALSGLHPASRGTVLYNGVDYYAHLDDYSRQIGYVPQDDIIHRRLRVVDALYYTAKLRLPRDYTREQIRERVDAVLEDVGLTHRRRQMVRNLSGGERKRVSIALELLANPRVFFLDEPSAGVDPGLDRRMMQLLRKLADEGHTIILVTHATENIGECDRVCFLARGGYLAFYGSPEEAKEYFGVGTFSEIYNLLEETGENKGVGREVEERYKGSAYYQRYIAEPLNEELEKPEEGGEELRVRRRRQDDRWQQFGILSRRYMRLLANDAGNLLILLLQAPVIALILYLLASAATFNATSIATCPIHSDPTSATGPIVSIDCQKVVDFLKTPQGAGFAQEQHMTKDEVLNAAIVGNAGADAQMLLFIMGFSAVLFGCINGAREIVKELPIYRRERMANLGIVPYMSSKIVILGVFCVLQSVVVVYAVNAKAPFHQGIFLPIVVEIGITMILSSWAGMMMGLLISAVAPNTDRAMSFVPLVLIPQVIFSGAIFKLNTPLLQAVGDLFVVRWALAGMGSSVGLHGDKLGVDGFAYQGTLYTSLDPRTVQVSATEHLLLVWGALVGLIVVLALLIGFFLKLKDRRNG